jgi:hypothetical protein
MMTWKTCYRSLGIILVFWASVALADAAWAKSEPRTSGIPFRESPTRRRPARVPTCEPHANHATDDSQADGMPASAGVLRRW